MARLPYLEKSDLAESNQDVLSREINLYKILAHSPNAARAFQGLGRFIRFESALDPRLRELAILMVGYLTRSPYEYSHHIKIGRDFGVSDDDIRGLIAEAEGQPSSLEPLAKTVLTAAIEMTRAGAVAPETFAALENELDREHLMDLIITIAFYNGVVRVLASTGIDVEDSYMPYLEEFPLPSD
ncbi:MAG: carboxymuconolactone decarboxylase family protein [Hyphomicrobiaceae bacterium]